MCSDSTRLQDTCYFTYEALRILEAGTLRIKILATCLDNIETEVNVTLYSYD
jgi:hypothetical protein